jgi:hypothetical protein
MIEIFHNNKCSVRHAHDSVFVGWATPTIGPQPGYLMVGDAHPTSYVPHDETHKG